MTLKVREKKRFAMAIQAHRDSHESSLAGGGGGESSSASAQANSSSRPVQDPKDRMKELIKKTIKSVAMYNSQLQKEVREERRRCFDLQTMVSFRGKIRKNIYFYAG